jgi:HK97 family phage portal protein
MKLLSRMGAAFRAFGYTLTNGWQGSWPTIATVAGGAWDSRGMESPMAVAAYFACLRVISEDVAKLPVRVYRQPGEARVYLTDHPIYKVMSMEPNREMTPQGFKETLTQWAMSWGNGYAEIRRAGSVLELWPIHPSLVLPDKTTLDDGTEAVFYRVTTKNGMRVLFPDEMFHLRGFGDGYVGYPVNALSAGSVGLSQAAQNSARTFFESGGRPSGVLSVPESLSPEARTRLRNQLQEVHGGSQNTNKVAIIDMGMTWMPMSVPPETSQMLETRKFQAVEICRWFRVPPQKIMDVAGFSYNALEQMEIGYANDSLTPWVRRWEQECELKLNTSADRGKVFVTVDLKGMMMGTHKDRADYFLKMVQIGALTPNEARVLDDRNPLPGGDRAYIQVNMAPVGMSPAEMQEKRDAREQQTTPTPEAPDND